MEENKPTTKRKLLELPKLFKRTATTVTTAQPTAEKLREKNTEREKTIRATKKVRFEDET